MSNGGNISVSVVVACRNEIKHIHRFLDSVLFQDLAGISCEVLIADGLSEDGTCEVLNRYQRHFPVIRGMETPGLIVSTGLNRAIRESAGDIVIRMDAHSEYAPDYIRKCLEVLKQTNAANVGGPVLTRAEGYLAQAIALAYHTGFACGGSTAHDPQFEGYVSSVTYGCWRKSTLERVGLFDERLCRSQDDELNRRIIAAGGKIYQSSKIISWYRPRPTLKRLFHQYLQYGFWKAIVTRKHRKLASWRHLIPAVSILAGAASFAGCAGAIIFSSSGCQRILQVACGVLAAGYLAASVGAAASVARRSGFRFFPVLPIVFATYHLSYGLGFLLGLTCNPLKLDGLFSLRKTLTAITR